MYKKNILKKSIKYLDGFGSLKRYKTFINEFNINTYEDLIFFPPKKYINISLKKISNLSKLDKLVQILGYIKDIKKIKYIKNNKEHKLLISYLIDTTGIIDLIWFNYKSKIQFIKNIIKFNTKIVVSGKLNWFQNKAQIVHPNIQKFNSLKNIHSIYPVYSLPQKIKKNGINNNVIIKLIKNLIKELKEYNIKDFFFNRFIKKKLMLKKEALIQLHFPKSLKHLLKAKFSIKFEILFIIKLISLCNNKIVYRKPFKKLGILIHSFCKNYLPFKLTIDQKKVFREIWCDLKKPIQMNRLLQGEVGSGKTIIAILAILSAMDNGFQSCLMTPTEVLAKQHYYFIKKIFPKIKNKVSILTKSTTKINKQNIFNKILNGKIFLLIGTHSLIYNKIKFRNLGLSIIDEQQRFGVEQRKKIYKNDNHNPHLLIMTATPIPRTLAKVLYNDVDISILKNKPIGQKSIKTIHLINDNKEKAFKIIKNQISKGRQIYIVYPIIKDLKNKRKNLVNGYKEIKERFKKKYISVLHGKMSTKDKDTQITRFLKGETKIMVTTTVIEVGIDISNVSVILIEDANLFGLSQLHQLRGRVGRGQYKSYCILITKKNINTESFIRIKTICKVNTGLEISRKDLKNRGSGDLLGTKQSGKNFLKIVDFFKDYEIIKKVIYIADNFIINNPNFLKENKNILYKYYKKYEKFIL